jgi:hypothetical protein
MYVCGLILVLGLLCITRYVCTKHSVVNLVTHPKSILYVNKKNNQNRSIGVITKLPYTEQSSKGKGKTHKSTNRQNQSTTGKLGKPQWT